MRFIDREDEMGRLDKLASRRGGGLVVVFGRRRIGKTRLLIEWIQKHEGLYSVADQSSAEVQRQYFAEAVSGHLEGFSDVRYPDWATLLTRLAREAKSVKWNGPIVIDEFPYLVSTSPELPSVLQRWIDHDAKKAGLVIALAGSSQRMMQGLVLSSNAPLYGRAREVFDLGPLPPTCVPEAFGTKKVIDALDLYAAWGGVPRYWELHADESGPLGHRIDRLVLDPLGPLHQEPDRLLIEEHPSAIELRPVLDAIGMGAHRVSEIAGRIGLKATSLSRPLDRILGIGLVKREIPFGESERKSRRSLYRIADPFIRLWFRLVAPHRGFLATASPADRRKLLGQRWPEQAGFVWEEICRQSVPRLGMQRSTKHLGKWGPTSRWWHGNAPEWDIVSESLDGKSLLLGEAKWSQRPLSNKALANAARVLMKKSAPNLSGKYKNHDQVRALFVPVISGTKSKRVEDAHIITGRDVFGL